MNTQINTLDRTKLFETKEKYLDFVEAYKAYANNNSVDSRQLALYSILRGRDWTKGWTTPSKEGKLQEHKFKKFNCIHPISRISEVPQYYPNLLKPFKDTVSKEALSIASKYASEALWTHIHTSL